MDSKLVVLLLALFCHAESRSLSAPRDLAADVAAAQAAVSLSLADTTQLFATLSQVDDVLMFDVQLIVGNIIVNLFTLGVGGEDLQGLQTAINHAEAVTVFQVYQQAYALLAHRDVLTLTQGHLGSDLGQLAADREQLVTSQGALDSGFATALTLTTAEVTAFNDEVNALIEGMSGSAVDEIVASLAAVNDILRSTRDVIRAEKDAVDASTAASVAALDVVIAQVPKNDFMSTGDVIGRDVIKRDVRAAESVGLKEHENVPAKKRLGCED